MDKRAYIRDEFSKIQIELSEKQAEQFEQYYEMLIAKNEVMNLTAITKFEEVVQKHFIDSVMIKEVRELGDNEKWIDVGTGAGFPGIPLKIVYPQLQVTLLDSLNKRVKFLQEVVDALAWKSGRIRKESRVPRAVRLLRFPGGGKFGVSFGVLSALCEGGRSIRTL